MDEINKLEAELAVILELGKQLSCEGSGIVSGKSVEGMLTPSVSPRPVRPTDL